MYILRMVNNSSLRCKLTATRGNKTTVFGKEFRKRTLPPQASKSNPYVTVYKATISIGTLATNSSSHWEICTLRDESLYSPNNCEFVDGVEW